MELSIKRSVLLEGIQKTLGITEKKATMPILNNVLLKAKNGMLTMIATDLSISLIAEYEAKVIQEGQATINARKLHEITKEADGDDVHITLHDNNSFKIRAGKSVYKMSGLPADEFPSMADIKGDVKYYDLKGSVMVGLINGTAFALAPESDTARKQLTGVLLETSKKENGSEWNMVGTDGHRLAMVKDTMESECPDIGKGVIIPRRGLAEIKKMAAGSDTIGLALNNNMIVAKAGATILKVNLIDGTYPEYKRIIPVKNGNRVTLDKDSFLHALKRMNVVSSERCCGVVLSISADTMKLVSENPDVGEAMEEVDAAYAGDDKTIGVNVNYMIDSIAAIPSKSIVLEIEEGAKPILVKPAEGDEYLGVVMPLMLPNAKPVAPEIKAA